MNEINNFVEPNRPMYELILDGIIIANLSGKISYVNSAACKLMNCDNRKDLKNKSITDCFKDSNYLDEIIRYLATQKSFVTTKICTKKDGIEGVFILCFSLLLDLNSMPIGLQVVFKNPDSVTDDNLYFEKRSALLKSLNYHSREIIYISDVAKKSNIFCSQAVEKILGWTQKDFLDGGWAFSVSLTHPDDAEMITEHFIKEMELRKKEKFIHDHKPIIYEYRKRHKNGTFLKMYSESILIERDLDQNPKFLMTFSRVASDEQKNNVQDKDAFDLSIKKELDKILLTGKTKNKFNPVQLSQREKEILQLVRDGLSTKEIADILCIKITSVNSYRKNLMIKVNAKNTAELVQKSNQFILT